MTTTEHTSPSSWHGTIAVDDTTLAAWDTGGDGVPVLFLNGSYADVSHWRKVITALGPAFRCITFDERARGRSGTSADYSAAACLRDIDAVCAARAVHRPLVVGWSYGAYLAVYHAAAHPDAVRGVVAVDGAMPYGLTGEDGAQEIRRLFRRVSWVFPVASRLGLAARMSGAQHAEVNIESNALAAQCRPLLESLAVPVRYVLGTGGHLGASAGTMRECRASLDAPIAANPRLRVAATVPVSHSKILARASDSVADVIRGLAAETADGARETLAS